MSVYTVTAEYFATGEGITHMILFTRAYPSNEDYEIVPSWTKNNADEMVYNEGVLKYPPEGIALRKFREKFGYFYSLGAEVKEGLHFDSNAARNLISEELRGNLERWIKEAGGFEYFTSLHMNFS